MAACARAGIELSHMDKISQCARPFTKSKLPSRKRLALDECFEHEQLLALQSDAPVCQGMGCMPVILDLAACPDSDSSAGTWG